MARIPEKEWRWHGHAGHNIIGPECRFVMHTEIGTYRISTVGDYYCRNERREVGFNRYYETYVSKTNGIAGSCCDDPDCTWTKVADWCEIDGIGANTFSEAEANHMAACDKYASEVA